MMLTGESYSSCSRSLKRKNIYIYISLFVFLIYSWCLKGIIFLLVQDHWRGRKFYFYLSSFFISVAWRGIIFILVRDSIKKENIYAYIYFSLKWNYTLKMIVLFDLSFFFYICLILASRWSYSRTSNNCKGRCLTIVK